MGLILSNNMKKKEIYKKINFFFIFINGMSWIAKFLGHFDIVSKLQIQLINLSLSKSIQNNIILKLK